LYLKRLDVVDDVADVVCVAHTYKSDYMTTSLYHVDIK